MGPNAALGRPDPDDPSKTLKHHYHCDGMRGTLEEAANYCGNSSKEEGCETYESGPFPESKQGHRTDHDEAQKIIIEKAREGMKFKDLKRLLPRFADQSLKWMRDIYLDHRIVRENFFETNEPYKWQRSLAEFLNRPPDPRAILFIVDFEGNSGKSEFVRNAHYLCPDKEVWYCSPKDNTSLSNLCPDDGADIILIDCPRTATFQFPYDFVEECKNGDVVNTKYECAKKQFKTPHVVVFMNRIPQSGKTILSKDRYVIKEVVLETEEQELLQTKQNAVKDPYLLEAEEYTRKVLAEAEERSEERAEEKAQERAHKRSRHHDPEGRAYIDNGVFLDGRKKTLSEWKDRHGNR